MKKVKLSKDAEAFVSDAIREATDRCCTSSYFDDEIALREYIAKLESSVARLVEDADEYAKQIQTLQSTREWRPIETAPKQDLFLGTDGCIVEISSWSMDPGIAHYYMGSYDDPIRYRPTHWMPLPEPPK